MTDLPALLKRARELSEAATPGPYSDDGDFQWCDQSTGEYGSEWVDLPNGVGTIYLNHDNTGGGRCAAAQLARAIVAWRSLILPLLDVAEAAASVCSEDRVREELLCYVMGSKLLDALAKLGEVKL